ncbi:MAG: hypothetical protein KHY88_00065 [Erysipelotrichaceae bacterium]|nr:hypothetical protein [Erysipelotrichaceae bacterium]
MKFKELRLVIICLIAFLGMVVLTFQAILLKDTSRIILTLVFSFLAITMVLSRFNMCLFNDYMLIYEYKIIGILPTIIEYKDVKAVKVVSKHKIEIKHLKTSYVYVFNAKKFEQALLQKLKIKSR